MVETRRVAYLKKHKKGGRKQLSYNQTLTSQNIAVEGHHHWYEFTPAITGEYVFTTSGIDVCGVLFEGNKPIPTSGSEPGTRITIKDAFGNDPVDTNPGNLNIRYNLIAGTKYLLKARGYIEGHEAGTTGTTGSYSINVTHAPLNVPNPSASETFGSVTISGYGIPNATGYEVKCGSVVKSVSSTTLSCVFPADHSTTYTYQVRAKNEFGGWEPWSPAQTVTPPSGKLDLIYSNVKATKFTISATNSPNGATGCDVRLNSGSWISLSSGTSYTFTNLEPNTNYTASARVKMTVDGVTKYGEVATISVKTDKHTLIINNYYDNAFLSRRGSQTNAENFINISNNIYKTVMINHFDIVISTSSNTPQNHQSYADLCGVSATSNCPHNSPACDDKGLCTTHIDNFNLCTSSCNSKHHHNHSEKILNWFTFSSLKNASNTSKNILWSGQKSCGESKGGAAWASFVGGKHSVIPYGWIEAGLASAVMLHEGGHMLGAVGDDKCPYTEDKINETPCIMAYDKDPAVEAALVANSATVNPYCGKCSQEIRDALKKLD